MQNLTVTHFFILYSGTNQQYYNHRQVQYECAAPAYKGMTQLHKNRRTPNANVDTARGEFCIYIDPMAES